MPAMTLRRRSDMARGDGSNILELTLNTHVGTHVDTPRHFIADGLSLTDFTAAEFVFARPACVEVPLGDGELVRAEHLEAHAPAIAGADLLLVRTGHSAVRASDPGRYSLYSPGFIVAGARFLREEFPGLRALGLDTISLACMQHVDEGCEAHRILLGGAGRRFFLFEDMDLSEDLAGLRRVIALPLMVVRADGGPCTILAELL